jgi:hypothetical protein
MTDYWVPTAMLFHRAEADLNDDERASLRYYIAFIDEMDGLRANSAVHRWCATARQIDDFVRERGRMPAVDDPEYPLFDAWIGQQDPATLNSFQRSRVEAIPGWEYHVS